jgi:hypothetical protein
VISIDAYTVEVTILMSFLNKCPRRKSWNGTLKKTARKTGATRMSMWHLASNNNLACGKA